MANVINWVVAHQAVVSACGVAVIDFVWAVLPNTKSSGIIHSVYDFLKNRIAPAKA